jgi:ATP-dependent DNA helicase RecG
MLQGDVGSGKTIVALLGILRAIEDGKQAALLVPTSILAKQHFETIKKYFALIVKKTVEDGGALSLNVELVNGGVRGQSRTMLLNRLRSGEINVLVGTHPGPCQVFNIDKQTLPHVYKFGLNLTEKKLFEIACFNVPCVQYFVLGGSIG